MSYICSGSLNQKKLIPACFSPQTSRSESGLGFSHFCEAIPMFRGETEAREAPGLSSSGKC